MDIIQKSIATVVYLRPKDACGHEHDNKSNQKSCAYEPTNKSPPLRGIATSSSFMRFCSYFFGAAAAWKRAIFLMTTLVVL